MTYLILPGKEQLQIVFKMQHSKSFNMKGFKGDPPDIERTSYGKEPAPDMETTGRGRDHTATLPPAPHLTMKDGTTSCCCLE